MESLQILFMKLHFYAELKEVLKIKIAIIDADLIGRSKHRFPNLACMKLSKYYKDKNNEVVLITNYRDLFSKGNIIQYKTKDDMIIIENMVFYEKTKTKEGTDIIWYCSDDIIYDKIIISKVFTDTPIYNRLLELPNVEYGGTGFYYDKAIPLPYEIEHYMPDYHLYDKWVEQKILEGNKSKEFEYYTDYSIGFTTRGCIRQCSFCVNKNYKSCNLHSSLEEFIDKDRKYICLLDDNIFACKDWKMVFKELSKTGKKFQFKQGIDERLLTDEKCEILFNSKWIGDVIFAFDNIKDREIIEDKLQMIRRHTNKQIKFYTLCAYNHDNIGYYDEDFWAKDINDLFERIKILMSYGCLPYVMRYKDFEMSPYRGMYINIASWCNQPSLFRKMSFAEFCKNRGMSNDKYKIYKNKFDKYLSDGNSKGSSWRYYDEFCEKYPDIANKYFHMKWNYSNKNT